MGYIPSTEAEGAQSTRLAQRGYGVAAIPPDGSMCIPPMIKQGAPEEAAAHVTGGKHNSIGVKLRSHPCRQPFDEHEGIQARVRKDPCIRTLRLSELYLQTAHYSKARSRRCGPQRSQHKVSHSQKHQQYRKLMDFVFLGRLETMIG